MRHVLPAPRTDRDGARALEKEARSLVEDRSKLDDRARKAARRANETAVRRFRAAELHDFLSVLPGASEADVSVIRALGARLRRGRLSPDGLARADGTLRSVVRRQLPVLSPFGFDSRYADAHPSLFEISA